MGTINKTYPADCRKIAAVDSHNQDWDWKKRKNDFFVQKMLLANYFDVILHFGAEHTPVS